MKFIKLTRYSDRSPVFVNMQLVSHMDITDSRDSTYLYIPHQRAIRVTETPLDILDIVESEKSDD
jgi:hypothetical protein